MRWEKKLFCKTRDTNPGILWTAPLVDVPEATVPLAPITTIPKIFNEEETYSGTLLTNLLNWHYGYQTEPQYPDCSRHWYPETPKSCTRKKKHVLFKTHLETFWMYYKSSKRNLNHWVPHCSELYVTAAREATVSWYTPVLTSREQAPSVTTSCTSTIRTTKFRNYQWCLREIGKKKSEGWA